MTSVELPIEWPEWRWFNSISGLVEQIQVKSKDADVRGTEVLYPFLDSVIDSLSSFQFLVRRLALRDAYVIARVIYETSVNACFLLTEPEKLSERASTHAKQKALRNLVRAIELAGTSIFEFKAQGAEELLGNPTHQDWLKEFTSKSGREITAWTPENVQQRLEAVYVKFGHEQTRGLAFGLLMYRNASEIAHGTLFGTLFSWGAMEPSRPLKSPSDLASFRRSELRHLLKLVSFSLESVVQIIGALVNVPDIAACATAARKDYYRDRDANA